MAFSTSNRSLGGCSLNRPTAGAFRLQASSTASFSSALRRPSRRPRIVKTAAYKGDKAEASTFTTTKQRYLAQHFKLQEAQHNACAGLDLPSQSHIKGLAWSAIELVAAQGNLALKQAHSSASLAQCTRGQIAKAQRDVEALSRRVIYTIHDALNGVNTRPGADFLALPKSLSIPLIDSCLAGSYISLDGQPIYSQQPAQPDTVDIWGYLATRASLVGRHEEIFGTSDMLAVPDAFPWLNTSTLSSMVTPSMATCFLASLPAASNLVDIVSAIRGSSEAEPGLVSAGRRADIIWTCLMVRKFAAAFAEQHLQSAGRVVAAAAAGVGRAGASSRGGKPRTSGDGGSGRGGVLKAVGAGDESELPVLVLPVQKLAGSGSSCDRSRGWLRRLVGGAAGRVARLLRA